ncbi:hypothetical protein ACYJ1Y_03245 [Natrialbaceae archaeon A-gly3]
MSDRIQYAGVFVLIVLAMTGIAATGALITADSPPTPTDATIDHDHYTSADVLEDAAIDRGEGEISFDSSGEQTVLIHNAGSPEDVEPIVDALVTHGHEVRFYGAGGSTVIRDPFGQPMIESNVQTDFATDGGTASAGPSPLEAELNEVDAFMIIGTADQFEGADVDAIEQFAASDGQVLIADDATTGFDDSTELTSRFGLNFANGYLYNMYENDANFQSIYAEAGDSDLADGVDRIVVHQAVPVSAADATPVATGLEETKHSTTREGSEYDVAVQQDNVVAIGDTELFRSLNYNRADNEVLIGNVLEFLTSDGTTASTDSGQSFPEEPFLEEPDDEVVEEPTEER